MAFWGLPGRLNQIRGFGASGLMVALPCPLQTNASLTCILSSHVTCDVGELQPRWQGWASALGAALSASHFHTWGWDNPKFPWCDDIRPLTGFRPSDSSSGGNDASGKRGKAVAPSCLLGSSKWLLFQITNIYGGHNSVTPGSVPSHRWQWNLRVSCVC